MKLSYTTGREFRYELVRFHFPHARVTIAKLIVTSSPASHIELWRHHQTTNRQSEAWCQCAKSTFWSLFMGSSCRIRNRIMYTVATNCLCAHSRVFWCLFISMSRNSGSKHKNSLLWAHKQFATPTHTLSPTYICVPSKRFSKNKEKCYNKGPLCPCIKFDLIMDK